MHERQEREPDSTKDIYTATLEYFLGKGNGQLEAIGGIGVAELLYDFLANSSPEALERVHDIAHQSNEVAASHLLDALDQADVSHENARMAFIESLGDIIKDVSVPDLSVNANAIRLAYYIKAWELTSAVGYVEMILAQIDDGEMPEWLLVKIEKDNFAAAKRLDAKPSMPPVFGEFIKTLDLEGFTGRK